MAVGKCSGSVTSLPPPRPKSPPDYPDLYGKRRELAKVQMMEREIGFLEEELKSVDGLQPASRSCKEFCDGKCRSSNPHKKEDSEISTLLEMDLVLSSEPCTCDVEYHVSTSRGYVAAVAAHLKVAPTAMHVVAVTHVLSAICLNAIVRPAGIANVVESRNVAWIVAVVSPNVLHCQPVVP